MQGSHPDVITGREHVIEQQAHANATIGCLQQLVNENPADDIVLDQVILHVDALLGSIRQQKASCQCIDAIVHRVKAGLVRRMLRHIGFDLLRERGV